LICLTFNPSRLLRPPPVSPIMKWFVSSLAAASSQKRAFRGAGAGPRRLGRLVMGGRDSWLSASMIPLRLRHRRLRRPSPFSTPRRGTRRRLGEPCVTRQVTNCTTIRRGCLANGARSPLRPSLHTGEISPELRISPNQKGGDDLHDSSTRSFAAFLSSDCHLRLRVPGPGQHSLPYASVG
jgi:hypothetical protein